MNTFFSSFSRDSQPKQQHQQQSIYQNRDSSWQNQQQTHQRTTMIAQNTNNAQATGGIANTGTYSNSSDGTKSHHKIQNTATRDIPQNDGGPEWRQYRNSATGGGGGGSNEFNRDNVLRSPVSNGDISSAPSSRATTPGLLGNDEAMTLGDVDTKAVDEMLSKDLSNLSFADRNAINEEVHGVRNLAADETPQTLEKSLWMFQHHLEDIQIKPAYDQAVLYQSRWVLQNPTLRLRCLRAERFNINKATRRFVNYLDLLLEYYGAEALMRPIRISDLGKEEMELLRSGEYQLLPFRDRSGRRVISCLGDAGMKYSLYTRVSRN
jgi:hypothetical protein